MTVEHPMKPHLLDFLGSKVLCVINKNYKIVGQLQALDFKTKDCIIADHNSVYLIKEFKFIKKVII